MKLLQLHAVLACISSLFVLSVAPAYAAVTFYINDYAGWQNALLAVGKQPTINFLTTAENIALANEVSSVPGPNTGVGNTLTFNPGVVSCRGFSLRTLQSGANFTFDDDEAAGNLPNFDNALSVGDIDNFENDDFEISFPATDPPAYAVSFVIRDSNAVTTEGVSVYGTGGVFFGRFSNLYNTNSITIGIISDEPISRVVFDEDIGGDDIAVADFTFDSADFYDTDNDGLGDCFELTLGTNLYLADTDGDGLPDAYEVEHGFDPLTVGDQLQDPDTDGLDNLGELTAGTDPLNSDSDGDSLTDGFEVSNGINPNSIDSDSDGLDDNIEVTLGTDPNKSDTDGDGLQDAFEHSNGFDPLNPDENANGIVDSRDDSDSDGLSNSIEANAGTDPNNPDTDGDGLLDGFELASGNYGNQQVISTAASGADSVFAVDIDSDGDMDVVSASSLDDKIAWYENIDGQGSFGGQRIISTTADNARSVFAADIDGDGDMDVLSASMSDNKIAWYENTDGMGSFGTQRVISIAAVGAYSVFAADIDSDGDLDVLSASNDDKIAWYENTDGLGNFGAQQIISITADGAYAVFAADMDNDGDMDVLSASNYDDKIAWYENTDGLGNFGVQQIISITADGAYAVFVADMDNDGDMDVLSASNLDDKIAWYENTDGQGSFGVQQIISTAAEVATAVFAADIDGDGDMDVLSASMNDDKIAWYENTDGQGSFGTQQVISAAADAAFSVFAADIDGDGDMDVLSASFFDRKIAWYENLNVSNPLNPDTDNDGLLDGFEIIFGFDPLSAGEQTLDIDTDGLDNLAEQAAGTDPNNSDTDGDGVSDGVELIYGTNPLDNTSAPNPTGDANGDGVVNAADVLLATRILQGAYLPTPAELMQLDVGPLVNGVPSPDGQFNLGDLIVIKRKALGEITY